MKKNRKKILLGLVLTGLILLVAGVFFGWRSFRSRYEYNIGEEVSKENALQNLLANNGSDDKSKQKLVPFGILTYHHIGPDTKGNCNRWCMHPEIFFQQINDLKKAGYQFMRLDEAMEKFRAMPSTTLPLQKTIVLTFDDGYRDFYKTVYPFLKENNIPATFFVIVQDIGHAGNVTWDMIKEMQKGGLVEIGSHTVHHFNLSRTSESATRSELFDSKKILEERLGVKIKTLAYPYGAYSLAAARLAQEAGYIGAVRVLAGQKPTAKNMYIWRRMIAEDNDVGEKFLKKIYYAFAVLK